MKGVLFLAGLFLVSPTARTAGQTPPCPANGPNLIVNGNFEQGYFGFTSDFGRGLNNATKAGCGTQGWIVVTQTNVHTSPACQGYPPALSAQYGAPNTATDPDPAHPSNSSVVTLAACNQPLPDHTTGAGFFLTIDPDAVPGRAYWKQRIRICPNTDYVFSVWVRNVEAGCGLPAPNFHFEVDGLPINAPTSYPNCQWVQTFAHWNSGAVQGEVWITLVNDQPGCVANDVAIDDLFFGICGGIALSCPPVFRFCGNAAPGAIALSGSASGLDGPQYQWQRLNPATGAWANLPGATDTLLAFPAPGLADTGWYRLLAAAGGAFGDAFCNLRSAALRVEAAPEYQTEATVVLCPGENYSGYGLPGVYVDTFLSARGCDSVRTLHLQVESEPTSLQTIALCPGSRFDFNGKSIAAPGRYVDTLSTVHGCDSIAVLEVQWRVDRELAYLPNAFSPNDDGLNDLFLPNLEQLKFQQYQLRIFDRWGNLVFSSQNPAAGWDGRFRGKVCPPGVYACYLSLSTELCQQVFFEGALSLIR